MLEASCLCGAVRYRIDGPVTGVVECHCSMCRKAAGGAFGAFFVALRDKVHWSGMQNLVHRESSPGLVRSFCRHCGTALTGANLAEPDDTIILSANALDGNPVLRVIAREHMASAPSWAPDTKKAPSWDGAYPHWQSLRPVP